MFPNEDAAKIAVETVRNYLNETGNSLNVVFNVFKDEDLDIYTQLLTRS
jgi:O-acetyl-ADP-ribose deacetylase (regulator of RNase III)